MIAFGSFIHGSGRTTVANKVASLIKGSARFSTGDIFRRIAEEMGYDDISEFSRYLVSHPDVMVRVENRLDMEAYRKIRELVRAGKIVVVDSNLHAHPHALRDVPSVHFYIYTHPQVIGERLVGKQRAGERAYRTPKEAVEAQIQRTRKDADRYAILKRETGDARLKYLYHRGEVIIRRLLRNYLSLKNVVVLRRALLRATHGHGILIDNSGDLTDTIKQVVKWLEESAPAGI